MSQYYHLKVREVIKETADAVTLVFDHPAEKIEYKSGQFLTLMPEINGKKERRSYSLCSSPSLDSYLAVTVKRVVNGLVSNFICDQMKAGDTIEVMRPMGVFTFTPDYHLKRNIVLIGAGSGITPLMSILKTVLSEEPQSNVMLVYGNRNEDSIIFKKNLEALKAEHQDRLQMVHVLSQPLNKSYTPTGRLNRSNIIKAFESNQNLLVSRAMFYLCGPEGMMQEALEALNMLSVPKENIFKESFVSTTEKDSTPSVAAETSAGGDHEVTILYQGSEYKFVVPQGKYILETAQDKNIDLPFSCQSGMCTACMGKCVSGKVHMDDPDGLSEREIQNGAVLTCVGKPVTSNVVIEID
jgi:ring-1,2-phenylacetyl-CoA epoxidase subunit PaaE